MEWQGRSKRNTRDSEAAPPPLVLEPIVDSLETVIRAEKRVDPFQRDPVFVRRTMPILKAVNSYFGAEVRGWQNVPKRGPFLVVGNHSGGAESTDLAPFMQRWVEDRGPEAPLYSLGYDLLFTYPVVGPWLRKIGILPASRENGRKALRQGAAVVVYPGGDYEVFRRWTERNRIKFGGRTGFVELALSTGVPVVPMTTHGAHESTLVVTRGRKIAHATGLERLHVKVFPFIWNIPLGLTPAFVPSFQLPAKVTVQVGTPLRWYRRYGPEASRDRVVVRRCYDEITAVMQETLEELARQHPYPILSRLDELRPVHILGRLLEGAGNGRKRPARSRRASKAGS